MNLSLFNKLNKNDIIPVILQELNPEMIRMHLISITGTYTLVTFADVKGSLPKPIITLNVRIDTLSTMLNRGYNVQIAYEKDRLLFYINKGTGSELKLTPVSIESLDDEVICIISKVQTFTKTLEEYKVSCDKIIKIEKMLKSIKSDTNMIKELRLEDNTSATTDDIAPSKNTVSKFDYTVDSHYSDLVEELSRLSKSISTVKKLDLNDLYSISKGASSFNKMVDMCGSFASVDLTHGFLLNKGSFPVCAISGNLLQNLLKANGDLYEFENELVFVGENNIRVFIRKYIPNTSIDFNVVDRDKILEYYKVNCGDGFKLQLSLLNKFPNITIDMGSGIITSESSIMETLEHKMEVNEFKSVQLNKLKNNPNSNHSISLEKITIPNTLCKILSLFTGNIEIAVKKNKIIFKKDKLYLVFGRTSNE